MALLPAWILLLSIFSAFSAAFSPRFHGHARRDVSVVSPIPPKQDPWYTAPSSYEAAAPGTVLRIRTAPGSINLTAIGASAVYNILYRTTDSQYRPAWAVTTLFVPANPMKCNNGTGGNCALVSYQIPYDSADLDASPSFALYGTYTNKSSGSMAPIEIAESLASGFYVNMPDYEGPLASFTAGVLSGHSTLDSVRAVLSSGFGLGDSSVVRYALWGYSGGALASEWAAELQVQYAPELNFSGAALGGLTPDIRSVMRACSGSACAGLIPAGILGLATQWPDVVKVLAAQLVTTGQYNATGFLSTRNMTLSQAEVAYFSQNIFSYFKNGSALLDDPAVKKAINSDGRMTYHGTPQMPIFAYKAIADEISPVNETDALVYRFCDAGVNIEYERNTIGGHSSDAVNGSPHAFAFISAIMNGTYVQRGCTITNTSVNITSSPY